MNEVDWYVEYIKDELNKLKSSRFVGNIEIKVNWKEGNIQNINLGLNKSIRKPA